MEKVELLKSMYGLDSTPKPADKTEGHDGDQANIDKNDSCKGDKRIFYDKITVKTDAPSSHLVNIAATMEINKNHDQGSTRTARS